MKDSIIVNVSELRSLLQDIRRDGMDCVRLSFSESFTEDDEFVPSALDVAACKKYEPDIWTDYDSIDSVSDEDNLENSFLSGVHMSSNLV